MGEPARVRSRRSTFPPALTRLFLGFTENFQFQYPNRLPGWYGDNGGTVTGDVEAAPTGPNSITAKYTPRAGFAASAATIVENVRASTQERGVPSVDVE